MYAYYMYVYMRINTTNPYSSLLAAHHSAPRTCMNSTQTSFESVCLSYGLYACHKISPCVQKETRAQ